MKGQANASSTDWNRTGPTAHAVQFYEHDGALADQLAGYVGSALVTGDAAVVVGTCKRRDELRERLALRGLDVEVARREGRYVPIDSEETLRRILSLDGWPVRTLFREVMSSVIERVITAVNADRPRIAIFGEMVALLCSTGNFPAAVHLEELWNELATDYAFSLCCAYPMSLFKTDASAAARFMKICAQHSHVFSAERRNATRLRSD